ncbi:MULTISPECIES: ABC transporter ATP-binding protein [unclassified Gemella]|uniref:ABC transporter ATP-binding protein n=1 Tax=unclassified Gemella TaxID=2624949 RepID=UPI001C03FA45|nr:MULTISPECIES: ABC transporter ATP-binding protein [unclassified Gemella]MBU0278396.1 ABC transporter ATP-binding protein [Gemella sp. zg-1178]QWQ38987.1 ABC transporter ATP-binding protein [Gemella sp. zg-570]
MKILEIENLTYTYPNNPVLENINMYVKKGEVVSIIGTSGVGKSTLFNIIAGIEKLQAGSIKIGQDSNFIGKVSYMLQKDLLLEHKTVIRNIALPLIIRGVKKEEALKEAEEKLIQFGLEKYKDKYPKELSGGMRQRIALLRTYMFKEKLFLLDEAFSALDAITKRELHQWYLDIHKKLGLTSLIITHDIEEAINLSDRIYILKNKPGQLVDEVVITFDETEDIDYQKLKFKKAILQKLGI